MQDAENKSIIGELTLCNLYKIVLGLRKKNTRSAGQVSDEKFIKNLVGVTEKKRRLGGHIHT